MNPHGRINRARRKLMQTLSGCMTSKQKRLSEPLQADSVTKVLICRPNGRLGNQLMVTPLVQEVSRRFPNSRIDLFVKGNVAKKIFTNYENIDRIITLPGKPFKRLLSYISVWFKLVGRRYDLVINAAWSSSSGRIATSLSRSKHKVLCLPSEDLRLSCPGYGHMARLPVFGLREYLGEDPSTGHESIPTLNIQLTVEERARGKEILEQLTGNQKSTIGIYTFATGAKRYDSVWWKETYSLLAEAYGEKYNIVEILPIENISQIDFAASSLYSKDIREMAAVISHLAIFITSDCGVMHLASAADVPVVALFCVTDIPTYQPYNHGSVAIDTNTEDGRQRIMAVAQSILNT